MFEVAGIKFHLYGLFIGVGAWIAMEIARFSHGKVEKESIENASWWALVSGLVGARIYHVADLWKSYYSANPDKIFALWDGGLGIWGGVVGGIVGLSVFCRIKKLNILEAADALVVGVPLAQTIGRAGNYFNGELYGKNGQPLFAYEGLLNLVLFVILLWMSRREPKSGLVTGIYLFGYGVIRVSLENLRPDEVIWRYQGVPVAVIFSVIAVIAGSILIFQRRRS